MNIKNIEAEREQHIEDFPVLVDFKDVFCEEIIGLPPKRGLYFSIELTLELIEKGYIRTIVSPWGAPILFIK